MGKHGGKVDALIGQIAASQHGAVTRCQLLAAGVTSRVIAHRIRSGMLAPIHRGVYLVGHGPPAPLAREAAAILACQPRALLSHVTAARLWDLPIEIDDLIDVTVVGRSRGSLRGLRVHAISALAGAELRRHEGIPITSPSLTLLDLASVFADRDRLLECVHEARVGRLVSDRELRATLAAHPNRPGARGLRRLLDTERGPRITRSKAERRALKVMREHGLEPDASDFPVGPYRLDFFFRAERVAVEYDSQQFHDNPKRFVGDRRRIAYLAAREIVTFPLTAHDLGGGAAQAMADLKATLAGRR